MGSWENGARGGDAGPCGMTGEGVGEEETEVKEGIWLRERMGGRVGAMKGIWGVLKLNVPRRRGEVEELLLRGGRTGGLGERVGDKGGDAGEGGQFSSGLREVRVVLRMLLSLIVVTTSKETMC